MNFAEKRPWWEWLGRSQFRSRSLTPFALTSGPTSLEEVGCESLCGAVSVFAGSDAAGSSSAQKKLEKSSRLISFEICC